MSTQDNKITFDELIKLAESDSVSENDLAKYFTQEKNVATSLSPQFNLNYDLVEIEDTRAAESAGLMNVGNFFSNIKRKNIYNRKLKDAKQGDYKTVRVVAEGDSWFQYPKFLDDVIDHLNEHKEIAVRCFSAAGDTLENMNAKSQFVRGFSREKPSVFLFSGGGNDMVAGRGLRRLLKKGVTSSNIKDYFSPSFESFKRLISIGYQEVFNKCLKYNSNMKIISHAYANAIPDPNKGEWLAIPMMDMGITDPELQFQISKHIVNEMTSVIKFAAEEANQKGGDCIFIDGRKHVGNNPNDWYDEYHLTSEEFRKMAAPMIEEILDLL